MVHASPSTSPAASSPTSSTELFLEPFGGLAGDMLLAALLDLGDDRFTVADLQGLADALVPGEAQLTATIAWRGSLSGTHLNVVTPETTAPPHRHLADLAKIVAGSPLSAGAQAFTMGVLRRIAVAEGLVHGCTPEEIHFHEVGAVDTLIDVGGVALALERLGITRVHAEAPILGSGIVRCAHGEMPVPAPATAEILRGTATVAGGGSGERCTPTGAALLMELVALGMDLSDSDSPGSPGAERERVGVSPGAWRAMAIGYGAGTRDPREGPPNLLRLQLGQSAASSTESSGEAVDELRVNLDDMTPEDIGYLVDKLREGGALEVFTTPVSMKKDRPGVLLTVLCRPSARGTLTAVLFAHSSTFGVRWAQAERTVWGRRFDSVSVDGVTVAVKIRLAPDGTETPFLEHDDLRELAEQTGLSLEDARRRTLQVLTSR